ncbi:cytosolic Fe-S cluster assembly factor nubp2 isoform X1 [Acipenser ruthenus]|uniref:cytosolic Fe-S cluster assembly factor nubp2 isoform X1 n=2 Tax=Acipenser ruthenus TaxID=7906 RepID=UPI00145A981F|nr:cytosolic Fe-S cluster assembly factor nubp2 isoform X1 [Acipenser ruthenus]
MNGIAGRAGSEDNWNSSMASEEGKGNLALVQHIVLVLSGKGGVGKSTITTELALALRHAGKKVGILDVDLCGPSIPHMLNVRSKHVHQCDAGWVPVYANPEQTIAVMSIGFLLENPDDAVVWRGPKKTALIKQFVSDVAWGELDYLIVDTPPGTSDEHLAVVESLRGHGVEGAVLVTTPQAVSTGDVRREITFCKKTGLRILGIVENMSGFACPHCSECTNIFSKGGGEELAKQTGVPFLGCVPLDPQLSSSLEEGGDFIQAFPLSATFSAINEIAQKVMSGAAGRR